MARKPWGDPMERTRCRVHPGGDPMEGTQREDSMQGKPGDNPK